MSIDFEDLLTTSYPTCAVQPLLNSTLREMDSRPLKGVGHLIELKIIKKP